MGNWVVTAGRMMTTLRQDHLLPQKLRSWFASKGIDIDDFVVVLTKRTHDVLHKSIKHPSTRGGDWIAEWQIFRAAKPGASVEQILEKMHQLEARYKINGLPLIRYKSLPNGYNGPIK